MTDVKGAFSLTLSPQALPGKCAGCGRATDKLGFIDTGLQFDYWGALLFCSECVLDMASKFGYITMEAADRLKSKVAELEVEVITQRKAILGLEEALDGLQAARDALNILNNSSVGEPITASEPSQETPTEEQPSTISETTESGTSEGNSEIDGSINQQGSDGVSGTSEYVQLDDIDW